MPEFIFRPGFTFIIIPEIVKQISNLTELQNITLCWRTMWCFFDRNKSGKNFYVVEKVSKTCGRVCVIEYTDRFELD